MLVKFSSVLSPDAFFLSKFTFSKNSFTNTIRVSNSLDPDQAKCFVRPDVCTGYQETILADIGLSLLSVKTSYLAAQR